jgi:hypothetical protein
MPDSKVLTREYENVSREVRNLTVLGMRPDLLDAADGHHRAQ